jgi:hypothetical protein
MTTRSENDYYNLIDSSETRLIVFGDRGEQWTEEVLMLLAEEEVQVDFFLWSDSVDLRLQLELVAYPVVQLWTSGKLKTEYVGYHCEALKNLIHSIKGQLYANSTKGHGVLN